MTIVFIIMVVGTAIYGYLNGWFTSVETMQAHINALGVWGLMGFIFIQILQVIVPIVPNQMIGATGAVIFGPFIGFICNYIGVCIGSITVFYLAKTYGNKIIEKLFSQKTMDKYKHWTEGNQFARLFAFAMICPGLPDDFLCYLAGTSNIKFRHFMIIILVGRATSQIGYSFAWNMLQGVI